MSGNRLIIVDDPDAIYAESRRVRADSMLFGRKQQSGTSSPLALRLGASRQQWELFEPDFQAALPVLEAFSQASKSNAGQPMSALTLRSTRLDDPDSEEIVRRHDFGLDLMQLFINPPKLTIDYMGFLQEFVDLNDDPWLEWVHPPTDHARTLAPFRQYVQPSLPWQRALSNYRRLDWYMRADEYAESDTVNRAFQPEDWVLVVRGVFPPGPFPAVQLEIFQIEPTLGSITLYWSASPGAAGYRLYTNGVPAVGSMPIAQQQLQINNLQLNTAYTWAVVAVNGYGIDASFLSNLVVYEHGATEVVAVYANSSDNPGSELP